MEQTKQCKVDDYTSEGDRAQPVGYKSLLHRNNEARLAEKDEERCRQSRNEPYYPIDFERYEIRSRYRKNWLTEGLSTHIKSEDGLV